MDVPPTLIDCDSSNKNPRMMNRTQEETSTNTRSPIADDVLDSDSEDEQDDKLKSIYSLRGGKSSANINNNNEPHSAKDDNENDDDDDDDDEDDDKVLEKLHVNPSLQRYDEFSSFLTRSERAHERPDVPPSKEALARRRVTILVDQEQEQKPSNDKNKINDDKPVADTAATTATEAIHGITFYYDSEPMTPDEIKAYFMQPEDFRRCDDDVDITTIRWNKAQKGHYKWDDNECTIRGLEEFCITKKEQKKKNKFNKNKKTTTTMTRSDFRYNHGQKVLAEVVRQKLENHCGGASRKPYNDEWIRQVSINITEPEKQRALQLAQQDEDEVVKMHHPRWKNNNNNKQGNNNNKSGNICSTSTKRMSDKIKGKGFFSFLQRNSNKKL